MFSSRYLLGFLLFGGLILVASAPDGEARALYSSDAAAQSGKGKKGDPPRPRPKPGPRDGGDDD